MKKDLCSCGNEKDSRSKQCRECFINIAPTFKICTSCKENKPVSEFRLRPRASQPRPRSTCRECEAKFYREYRKAYPEKALAQKKNWDKNNPEAVAKIQLRRKARALGLDPEMIAIHFENHHGLCDICNQPPAKHRKNLSIDHDHKTGKFRGLLCDNCNLALGLLKDDPDRMARAIQYLLSSKGVQPDSSTV